MEDKKNIIIIISIIIILLLIVVFIRLYQKKNEGPKGENMLSINYNIEGNETKLEQYKTKNPVVAMYIEGYGSIVAELYPEIAPNTVNNFIYLIKKGFYDNNSFHRLVKDFVLQGGDPDGKGTGGPGYTIKGEFNDNGFKNKLKHEKGILSMARGQDNDSAGSQFFIMLDKAEFLDGKYAAFGKVIDGMENVERIEKTENIADTNSGKLATNLKLKKVLVDLKNKEYEKPNKIKK